MITRWGALGVFVLFVACSDSSSAPNGPATGTPPNPPGATPTAPPSVTTNIDDAGGTVRAGNVILTIPAGAVPASTAITVTKTTDALPSEYTGLSDLYTFGPDGTVFAKPVTIAFDLTSKGTEPTVFWSNASDGFDPVATTVTDTGVTASIEHFSRGFVAEKKKKTPQNDGGVDDAGTEGGTPDGGAVTNGITATIDGTATTFASNLTVVSGATTTISADDTATGAHWRLALSYTAQGQQACVLNGFIFITYTHYNASNAVDKMYSTKAQYGTCVIVGSSLAAAPGDQANGSFTATVGRLNAPVNDPTTHVMTLGAFDGTAPAAP